MNRVTSVIPLTGYLIVLTFLDGVTKTIDIRPFIKKGLSLALLDESFFRQVALESGGGICWPNGYDFCPNFLHDEVPAVDLVSVR